MITRQEKILSCIDLGTQLGIEIGPLNKPVVTREMGNIRYVDHASTEDLRQKYAADPNVDINQIVSVDYIWGEKTLPKLLADEAPFDYVIASHVIEHVPDFIGWLKEIHAALKPGGILSLVIPDKRYCFDYYRQPTQPADTIDAYLRGARQPAPRQIFEFFTSIAYLNDQITWSRDVEVREEELVRLHSAKTAWEVSSKVFSENTYHDVHCWVFTPNSFFELLKTLIEINLFDFKVSKFYQTEGCEFYVTLEALDLSEDRSNLRQAQLESLPNVASENSELADKVLFLTTELEKEHSYSQSVQNELETLRKHFTELEKEHSYLQSVQNELEKLSKESQSKQSKLEKLQSKLEKLRAKKQWLRKKVQNLQTDLKTQQEEIAAMQSSKFWKLRAHWVRLRQLLGFQTS